MSAETIKKLAEKKKINFRYIDDRTIGISIDETTSLSNINDILKIFATANQLKVHKVHKVRKVHKAEINTIPENLRRKSGYLKHPVFSKFHSETGMMRYINFWRTETLH